MISGKEDRRYALHHVDGSRNGEIQQNRAMTEISWESGMGRAKKSGSSASRTRQEMDSVRCKLPQEKGCDIGACVAPTNHCRAEQAMIFVLSVSGKMMDKTITEQTSIAETPWAKPDGSARQLLEDRCM
jgi:hypothetical protein